MRGIMKRTFICLSILFATLFSLDANVKTNQKTSPFFQSGFFQAPKIRLFQMIQRSLQPEAISFPWKQQRINNNCDEIISFNRNFGLEAPHKRLVAKVSDPFECLEDIEITCDLLETINASFRDENERLLVTGEILTKVLAYRDLRIGQNINIPVVDKHGQYIISTYEVDQVFNLWNGMPAFGLVPKDRGSVAPILLFRGTDLSLSSKRSLSSILADLDISGPGHSTYLHARPYIRKWLEDVSRYGEKTRVMGFSLGGAFASYTLIYEHDLVTRDKSNPSIAFNTPGVTKKLYNKWQSFSSDYRPPFVTFQTKHDAICKVGHLIGDIYKLSTETQLPSITAHVILISGQPSYYLRAIQKNNKYIWEW